MAFAKLLADPAQFPVALEITPPQKPAPKLLLRRAGMLGSLASAVNVIQRPGRVSSLEASCALLDSGLQPAWHLVTRGTTRSTIRIDIERAAVAGIELVLCIKGDDGPPDTDETPAIREVVGMAVEGLPAAIVGATFNQYGEANPAALKNLGGKVAAGARYVQTQPVFDAGHFLPVADRLRQQWPGLHIVAMVMPLSSPAQATRIGERLRIAPPIVPEDEVTAWDQFAATVASLRESPLVDGIALMTFEMDPEPATAERITAALRAAGVS